MFDAIQIRFSYVFIAGTLPEKVCRIALALVTLRESALCIVDTTSIHQSVGWPYASCDDILHTTFVNMVEFTRFSEYFVTCFL